MLNRVSLGLLFAIAVAVASCNSQGEKKNESSSVPINNAVVSTQQSSSELTLLEQKFKNDSQNLETRTELAANYYAAGVLDKAAYHFMKVYERDNINLVALSNLGNIYYDTQQDDKAIEFYGKALALDPGNIDMRCDLATCYGRINRVKKAIEILKENIKMNSNHVKSHHNLAVWLRQNGNIEEADMEMSIYKSLSSPK